MSKTVKRLIVAAFLSACGFATTITWYKLTSDDERSMGSKKIARLVYAMNSVQRKQAKKLIWQPALESEDLYVGESIRTSSTAEARIEFIDTKAAIDLEPDSAIVLEEADGKMALNFLKGNIVVKADGKGGTGGLTLKSGNKNIALGSSEVSLGKGSGEELDLQVLKGSVSSGGKVLDQAAMDQSRIRILSPLPGSPIYLDTKENEAAIFKWTPLSAAYNVFVETGDYRDQMKPLAGATGKGDTGEIKSPVKVGKTYFRLVARTADNSLPEITSSIVRVQFLAKIPPQPLSPEQDSQVAINKNDTNLKFLWSNPAGFAQVVIEIASSPDLKSKIKTEYLKSVTEFNYRAEKPGVYYWRVSGVLEGQKEVISSKVYKFNLKIQDEVMPPELEKPLLAEKISEDAAEKKGVTLSWKPVVGASQYKVYIAKKTNGKAATAQDRVFEEEGKFLQTKIKSLKAGNYEWSVASINAKGEISKFAEPRPFSVQSLPLINWADNKLKDDHYYISLKPSVTLKWDKGDNKATKWRLVIELEDGSYDPMKETLNTTGAEVKLPKDGIYNAEVEGLDDRGVVVARSQTRRFRITPAPLLPPPSYAAGVPDEVEASNSGNARIAWQTVNGASEYVLVIKKDDGTVARELSSVTEEVALKGLMPGKYKMTLKSVDKTGRAGPEGEEKVLSVPNTSGVQAPKLKGFKVK